MLDEIEAGLQGAEGDLSVIIGPDGHYRGLDQVEMAVLPEIGFDDPPAAEEQAVGRLGHGGAVARSLGRRIRSSATRAKVKASAIS